jgi:hypothetical protein
MRRTVTLVLVDAEGTLIGMLQPISVVEPWWQSVADVIATARELTGFQLNVLRLLASERDRPPGGAVTYLAEVQSLALSHLDSVELAPVPASLVELALRPESLRAAWATPGGPGLSVAWARSELHALGRGTLVRAAQQRVWNLSATWLLESRTRSSPPGATWLKQVPPFFAHEASVLRWLGERVPGSAVALIASDAHGRALLEHVDGEDAYGSGVVERDRFAVLLHRIQTTALERVGELIARGVPDRRGVRLIDFMRAVLARARADTRAVSGLLGELPQRFAAIEACGIGDTLVHGDFHPGNVRTHAERATLIDWGDSFVGHPAFDLLRLTDGCDADQARFLERAWSERWRAHLPACEPERALELLRPITALRHAAHFADICSQIEPTERPFHASDVSRGIELAAALWRAEERSVN